MTRHAAWFSMTFDDLKKRLNIPECVKIVGVEVPKEGVVRLVVEGDELPEVSAGPWHGLPDHEGLREVWPVWGEDENGVERFYSWNLNWLGPGTIGIVVDADGTVHYLP